MAARYRAAIQDHIDRGIIEVVHDPNPGDKNKKDRYYLAHREIFLPLRITTKSRIVFDASSKTGSGRSLNDCLYSGPPLQLNIIDVELKFRTHKIAIQGDVSKMFHGIQLHQDDRDFVRFLWQEPENDAPPIIYRFNCVVFGATDSPFQAISCLHRLANEQLNQPNLSQAQKEACNIIQNSTYVDDVTGGANDPNTAHQIIQALTQLLLKGNFKIHKWASNCPELLDRLDENSLAPHSTQPNGQRISEDTACLGVQWHPPTDTFHFSNHATITSDQKPTKKSIASVIARLYDPLGLISPFVLQARKFLRTACKNKLSWKKPLPEAMKHEWEQWLPQISALKKVNFPRHIQIDSNSEFHIFADASETGYGAVAYVRNFSAQTNTYQSHLLFARSRIAPIKERTIPQMELQAALLATDLAIQIQKLFKPPSKKIYCYGDSAIVQWWLRRKPDALIPFVANRVEKIQQRGFSFHYVSTKQNPADLASRGCAPATLNDPLWKNGPAFLSEPRAKWPATTLDFTKMQFTEGLKKTHVFNFLTLTRPLSFPHNKKQNSHSTTRFEFHEYYSNYATMLQKTANLFHAVAQWQKKLKAKRQENFPQKNRTFELDDEDWEKAHDYWIRRAQSDAYPEEIAALQAGKNIPKHSAIRGLTPFLENGLLRVGGRLQQSELTTDAKHPIILPRKHKFTRLLVWYYHKEHLHAPIDSLHFNLRQLYWIVASRQLIRSIQHKCATCQRHQAPRASQQMAPLPPERLAINPPFSHVGVDYSGSCEIRIEYDSPITTKAYIVLFTCLATRAVHLELALSQEAEEFLLAFQRFTSTRGMPQKVFSDNAKYFKRADLELSDAIRRQNREMALDFYKLKFSWQYSSELCAPHRRCVGTTHEGSKITPTQNNRQCPPNIRRIHNLPKALRSAN